MFNKILLASAAVMIAVSATAPDFVGSSSAEAQTEIQPMRGQKPDEPKRSPNGSRVKSLKTATHVDLYGEPAFFIRTEGQPDSHFCSRTLGNATKPHSIQIKVRNKGDKIAGPVQVFFNFIHGTNQKATMDMTIPDGTYHFQATIPANSWKNGKSRFIIRIDHPNKIAESNESNNTYQSFCLDTAS